jgi:hypothetical protein
LKSRVKKDNDYETAQIEQKAFLGEFKKGVLFTDEHG